ncbi:helix-turn-helix domain-containing protein [Aliiroseovarius sp. F20344]|uniref:AraC family transcriptional regulator n=1 Tax=Aliiroseovarius sp. F20344 TaxID=2926414 RepID=UPI001FF2C947|nr:helix-turn-helix domain-containing protein [Aliiroseovarius sp. F20344]MCK0142770.1 AraC family transcriptional regulator [Aliiroseovarius sp. F20344]
MSTRYTDSNSVLDYVSGPNMIFLDLALRGGAVTILLLLAMLIWRAPIGRQGRLSVTALAVSMSAFLITTAAMPLNLHPVLHSNLTLLSSVTPIAVTWLIITIFLDAPGQRWPWIFASVATSAALYSHLVVPSAFPVCLPMGVLLYGALFALSIWSTRDDLVECRCRARPGFAAAIAGLALFLTLGQATGVLQEDTVLLALSQAFGIFAVALAFAVWLLRPDVSRWPGEVSSERGNQLPVQEEFADPALIARIQDVMANSVWREEGLTIGTLAGKLAVPEHRLRRAINQGLGHRNFSSFINRARIEAACAALTDPTQLNVTVLEIAYNVGFASIGPFNRAFRAEVGQSPTEYRRLAQSNALADSDESSPIAANLH